MMDDLCYLKDNSICKIDLEKEEYIGSIDIIPGTNIIRDEYNTIEYLKNDMDIKELYKLGYILKLSSFNKFCTLTDLIQFNYEIKITNKCFYHLINNNKIIYIKPMPIWITDGFFIEKILKSTQNSHDNHDLISNINGFLDSYYELIKTKIDFQYAVELKLFDNEIITWDKWQIFTSKLKPCLFSRRYCYQILNMTNINIIYFILNFRILFSGVRINFTEFIMDYYIISIAFFAFFSILLSVAQVIMSLPLSEKKLIIWNNIFYPISIITLSIIFLVILIIISTLLKVFFLLIYKYIKREFILKKWEREYF